jgi:hypothetical protein
VADDRGVQARALATAAAPAVTRVRDPSHPWTPRCPLSVAVASDRPRKGRS